MLHYRTSRDKTHHSHSVRAPAIHSPTFSCSGTRERVMNAHTTLTSPTNNDFCAWRAEEQYGCHSTVGDSRSDSLSVQSLRSDSSLAIYLILPQCHAESVERGNAPKSGYRYQGFQQRTKRDRHSKPRAAEATGQERAVSQAREDDSLLITIATRRRTETSSGWAGCFERSHHYSNILTRQNLSTSAASNQQGKKEHLLP
jgi:hypothetical protein